MVPLTADMESIVSALVDLDRLINLKEKRKKKKNEEIFSVIVG